MARLAEFVTPNCCTRPKTVSFDFRMRGQIWANRHCRRCQMHWYGPPNNVKTFTKAEWDKWASLPDNDESDLAWFAQFEDNKSSP